MKDKANQRFPRRTFVPYVVLVVGLLFTLFATYYVAKTTEAKDLASFNNSVQDINHLVKGRPRLYMELLRAGTGLFAARPSIGAHEFKNFVERLELADQYPGSQGIGYAMRVPRANESALVRLMEEQGFKGFRIWPAAPREE